MGKYINGEPAEEHYANRITALERAIPNVPPIFHHLFALLPKPGDDFPADRRIAFLRACVNCADLVYGESTLSVELVRDDPVIAGSNG